MVAMSEDPEQSPYYEVHHEQHNAVRDEDRKDGVPSRMPDELHGLVGAREGQLVERAREEDA
jgi:hypothetical protein